MRVDAKRGSDLNVRACEDRVAPVRCSCTLLLYVVTVRCLLSIGVLDEALTSHPSLPTYEKRKSKKARRFRAKRFNISDFGADSSAPLRAAAPSETAHCHQASQSVRLALREGP